MGVAAAFGFYIKRPEGLYGMGRFEMLAAESECTLIQPLFNLCLVPFRIASSIGLHAFAGLG